MVSSITDPIASGWSKFTGWASHPLENAAFARRTPKLEVHNTNKYGDPKATTVDPCSFHQTDSCPTFGLIGWPAIAEAQVYQVIEARGASAHHGVCTTPVNLYAAVDILHQLFAKLASIRITVVDSTS